MIGMGIRLGGRGDMRRSDLWTAGMAGVLAGGIMGGLLIWAQDDDPEPVVREPYPAEIDAAMIVNAAVVEMRGYGPDGELGTFLYDCEKAKGEVVEGDPTLICTQREEEG